MNLFALSAFAFAILYMAVSPVSAHGYVSDPPSRQAFCRDVPVPGCGDVKYEPQSSEAPKGSFLCNGDGSRFPQLNDESLWGNYFTTVQPDNGLVTFTWTLTVAHATSTWEYFVLTAGNTQVASFNDGGAMPPTTVVHDVPLVGFAGRQTILARWNIADTINAFYSCVDLDIDPVRKANNTCIADTDLYRSDQQNVLVA
ncbi:chitin binding protein [Roridomyces roridus]|uniref:Chitin binding protein n=1 Tax=Roridomyces roridus TaxID=1738132 RepID=A0AAD7C8R0_9AGAR|nr:chitin binding protein [Roridomyces roridus]